MPDALRIWRAGLEAVRSERLIREHVRVAGHWLIVGEEQPIDLQRIGRIAVVGAGKAGAGMAAGLEEALGPEIAESKQLVGWVNVPADCVPPGEDGGPPRTARRIHLHAARPAGRNEPTAEGVAGTEEILKIVSLLRPDDLCLCLISGGGSALLPAPAEGISLADKLAVTQHLSAAGADIRLNTVRKQLSRIKGGGLARACRAGRLVSLIISDVLGDPLDLIASGPTVPDHSTPADALTVLERVRSRRHSNSASSVRVSAPQGCRASATDNRQPTTDNSTTHPGQQCHRGRCGGPGSRAARLFARDGLARQPEGLAEPIGRHLAEMAATMLAGRDRTA